MTLKALATIPTAFLAGIVAPLSFSAWEQLDPVPSRASGLIGYAVVGLAPFVVFVIGFDRKRWDGTYWFSQTGKTDHRRTWIRYAAYFVGLLLGNAI
jgi:hypothetical protein